MRLHCTPADDDSCAGDWAAIAPHIPPHLITLPVSRGAARKQSLRHTEVCETRTDHEEGSILQHDGPADRGSIGALQDNNSPYANQQP